MGLRTHKLQQARSTTFSTKTEPPEYTTHKPRVNSIIPWRYPTNHNNQECLSVRNSSLTLFHYHQRVHESDPNWQGFYMAPVVAADERNYVVVVEIGVCDHTGRETVGHAHFGGRQTVDPADNFCCHILFAFARCQSFHTLHCLS